jgi:hypothetical protein
MTNAMATPPDAAARLPSILRWSLADAWAWLGHGWMVVIHLPYLGLIGLVVAAALALRALGRLLR